MTAIRVVDLTIKVPDRTLLQNVNLSVSGGALVAIMGPSGSGKSSLLNCLCGISVPSDGLVEIQGSCLQSMSSSQRAKFRLEHVGIVFQFGELLPELTVLDNVALPLRLQRKPWKHAQDKAKELLSFVGLGSALDEYPTVLSGGEIQRAAIARAVASDPEVILADEPTGALDEANGLVVVNLLESFARQLGAAVIVATHNAAVAARADSIYKIKNCSLVSENGQA